MTRKRRRQHQRKSPLPFGTVSAYPCPDCGDKLALKPSKYGCFYSCVRFPACRGSHGAHQDGRPLGVPATLEVKMLRQRVHDVFDPVWKAPDAKLRRTEAYKWLAGLMGLEMDACHIGLFDKEQCEQAIQILKRERGHDADAHHEA